MEIKVEGEEIQIQCVYGPAHRRHLEEVLIPTIQRVTDRPIRLCVINFDGGSKDCISSCRFDRLSVESLPNNSGGVIGFAEGHNLLFSRFCPNNYFAIINPDCVPQARSIDRMIARMGNKGIAIVEGRQWPQEHPKEYDVLSGLTPWASGAFQLIDAKFYADVGGMDETYFLYLEDVDLSWRAWLGGWSVVYEPDAVVTHFSGGPFYRKDIVSREAFYGARNFIAISRKFFGAQGEERAIELLLGSVDQDLAQLAIREYREKIKNRIAGREILQSHPMVKILGLNQFHEIRK